MIYLGHQKNLSLQRGTFKCLSPCAESVEADALLLHITDVAFKS